MRKLFKYQTDSGDDTSPEEWVDECYLGTHTPLTGTRKRFNQILSGTGDWGTGWWGTQPNLDENTPDDVDTFIGEMSKYYNYYVEEFDYWGEHHPNPWDIAWTPLVKGQLIRYYADVSAASRDYDALGVNGAVNSADSTNLSLDETDQDTATPIAVFTSSNRHYFCDAMRVNMRNFDGDFAHFEGVDDTGKEHQYYVKTLTAYTFMLFEDWELVNDQNVFSNPVQILKLPRDQYTYSFAFTQPDEPVKVRFYDAQYKDGTPYNFTSNGTGALCRWEEFTDPNALIDLSGDAQQDFWIDKPRSGSVVLDANEYYLYNHPTNDDGAYVADFIDPAVGYAFTRYYTPSYQSNENKPKALFWDRGDIAGYADDISAADVNRLYPSIWTGELFDNSADEGKSFAFWDDSVFGDISTAQTSNTIDYTNAEFCITDGTVNVKRDMLRGQVAWALDTTEVLSAESNNEYLTTIFDGRENQYFAGESVEDSGELGTFFASSPSTTDNTLYDIVEKGWPVVATNYKPNEELILFLAGRDADALFEYDDTPIVEVVLPLDELITKTGLNTDPWPIGSGYIDRCDNGDITGRQDRPYFYAERIDQSWYGSTAYGNLKSQHLHSNSGVETKGQAIKLYYDKAKTKPVVADKDYVPITIALPIQNIWIDADSDELKVELHGDIPFPHIIGDDTLEAQRKANNWGWPRDPGFSYDHGTFEDDGITPVGPIEYRKAQNQPWHFDNNLTATFIGLEDVDHIAGTGDFLDADSSAPTTQTWTATGGHKWSRLNGVQMPQSFNLHLDGTDTTGAVERTVVSFYTTGLSSSYGDLDWAGKLYEPGDYPYNPYTVDDSTDDTIPVDSNGDAIAKPVSTTSTGVLYRDTDGVLMYTHTGDMENKYFYNPTEWHIDEITDAALGPRATNADGSLKNIAGYIVLSWGRFTRLNVADDLQDQDEVSYADSGISNTLIEPTQDLEFEAYHPTSTNIVESIPHTSFWTDDTAGYSIGFSDVNWDRFIYDNVYEFYPQLSPYSTWGEWRPLTTTIFKATEVSYFPHAFDSDDVVMDIYDEDATEATTGDIIAAEDEPLPVRLDIDNLEFMVPGNKPHRYIDWNTATSDTDYTYKAIPISGHWWEPGSTTDDVVMRDPNTQSRTTINKSGLGDTHNGWGHKVFPNTGESVYNPANPNGLMKNEEKWNLEFEVNGEGRLTGNLLGDLDTYDCTNVGLFDEHREGQEVLLEVLTNANVGEEPATSNADKILAEESFDMATAWLDTDDAPSEERYWPRSEEGKCMTPSSAKIIIDQPASSSVSQSGVKYVRSAGYTQWRLELKYPPMLQEEWEPFNAAIHKARGEMRSFRLSLRHYKGFNWLFGTQGYFENRLHHQGAGYNKEYYQNVKHTHPGSDFVGAKEHTRHCLILEDVMPGDTVVRTAGWPSHTSALPEGSLVGGLGGRNGGVNTIVSSNTSNIWGECEFRLAYPLQATYQSGYDMNAPILQKGDFWAPEPDWLRVSLDEESIDFDVNLISRFGFTMKFRLDDVK